MLVKLDEVTSVHEKKLETMRAELNEVTLGHEFIKGILQSKKNAWLKPEGEHVFNANTSDCLPADGITSLNQFRGLDDHANSQLQSDEISISPDDLDTTKSIVDNGKLSDFEAQINNYRSAQQSKYNCIKSPKRKTNRSANVNATTKQSQVLNQNRVLIIGDSMIKKH